VEENNEYHMPVFPNYVKYSQLSLQNLSLYGWRLVVRPLKNEQVQVIVQRKAQEIICDKTRVL